MSFETASALAQPLPVSVPAKRADEARARSGSTSCGPDGSARRVDRAPEGQEALGKRSRSLRGGIAFTRPQLLDAIRAPGDRDLGYGPKR